MRKTLLTLLLPLALVACTDRQQEAAEADAEQVAGQLDASSEQFRTEAQQAATDLDQRIQALEASAQNATGEARERYNVTLNELREDRTALQADLDRFATVTQDDFDDLRDDVSDKQADIEADLDHATLELADTKAEFEVAARRRLARFDRDMERLQADGAAATGEAREDAGEALDGLRVKRRALGERFDRAVAESEANFQNSRGDLVDDFADLRRDVSGAMERLAQAVVPGS